MSKSFWQTKFGIIVLLLILIGSALVLAQEVWRRWRIDQEISRLEQEIEAVEGGNQEALALINYFQTPEYRERQARSLLNLKKPGEFAVALPNIDERFIPKPVSSDLDTGISNLRAWWDYFFNQSEEQKKG